MKTKFVGLVTFIACSVLYAQIPNNSFELNNHCNLSAYWSYMPLQAIIIDSLGPSADSVIWDGEPYLTYPDSDAHTGNLAISIRNAYSYSNNEIRVGRSTLYPDSSECTFFFETLLPVNNNPADFSFYYKFVPLNGDTASAVAVLYDQFGYEVARAEKWITGIQNTYTQEVIPFNYTSTDPVAYYSISFHNQIADGNIHQASLGTRLWIDDVALLNNMPVDNPDEDINLHIFPNPVTGLVNIQSAGNTTIENISVINFHGQVVQNTGNGTLQYNCSDLANGIYQLKITTNKGIVYKKLVKN